MGSVVRELMEGCHSHSLGEECMLDGGIKAKEGRNVTGSWDKASLYAL
jgi:hypothetical protein